MAGLLDWIDQKLGTRLGLLASDPRAAMAQMNQQAGAYNQASLLATQAERNVLRGLPVTPEQAAAKQYVDKTLEDVAMGFAGTIVGKPINLWHGSKDIRWIDKGDVFNPSFTANMPSKYMWASPEKNIAKTYAGISDMQLEKYSSGLGSKPSEFAGIRPVVLQKDAKILNVKDVKKSAKDLGIEFSGDNALENLLNAAKDKGYDAVRMIMDGGNIAILNPKVAKF